MADENIDIQQQESQSQEITPAAQGITFEDILPWGMQGGDTGLSSRLKLKRNFDKIQTRFNVDQALYLSKINDDTAQGFIRFIRGLQVGERFVTGLLGEGGIFRKEADGTTYIEADKLYIRMKAYFDNVEIRDFKHSAGNRIASPAGMKCCRVEWLDAGGDVVSQADANLPQVVKFRCYFRGSDGEDEVRNNFVVGDQAYCHVTTVETEDDSPEAKGLNLKHYWRLVVGRNPSGTLTADGEHWIDLSNRASETLTIGGQTYTHAGYQSGSDIPVAQDDIIQLGNINDKDRQGAIIEFVTGADSPSYQIFQDINDFNLNGKNYIALGYSTQTGRAYLNVYGDTFIGDPEESTYIRYNAQTKKLDVKATVTFVSPTTHEDTTIEDFAAAVTSDINTIQNQIDGTIETWFYNGVPGDSTLPESQWKAIDEAAGNNNERLKHLGDMYYDNQTGYAYRYTNQGTEKVPQFVWNQISDSAVVKALADAAKAQDTADHKRRVFLTKPTPPYDAGDMWVNAVWPESGESQGPTYNNDILRCKTAKTSTQSFSINDWGLASKYTDDSVFNAYINQILNGSGASGDSATVANAIRTIKGALNEGTAIDGGLVLTSLLAMRSNNKVWAGISGVYDDSLTTGGIAAWFGGAMKDKDVDVTATDCAKSLFRMDGSGYVANGNIAWDSTGLTTLNVSSVSADTIKLGGKGVATQDWVKQNYISIAYFDRLFRAYNGNNIVQHNDVESTIDNIKAMFGFWTDFYISALGNGGQQSVDLRLAQLADVNVAGVTNGQVLTYSVDPTTHEGKWVPSTPQSGTDMNTVWANLAASGNQQIDASHISTALSGYATQNWVGHNYLSLGGGTMSTTNVVTNLNADMLDDHDSTYFVNQGTTWSKTQRSYGYILEIRADYESTADNPFQIIGGNSATVIQNLPENINWGAQLAFGFSTARIVWRSRKNSNSMSDWVGIIAGSADKLETARTIWGQKFDGTGNVSGAINGATTISASGNVSVGGTLDVTGATTLSSTLSVSGLLTANGGIKIPSGKTLQIGDAVLSWDSTNKGIKITKGLYSETFISALGRGSDSGAATSLSSLSDVNTSGVANGMSLVYRSGIWRAETISSGTDMATVWAELGASTTNQINASHLTDALGSYAQKSELSSYLPLTGGTMANTNIVTNLNADLLDGHDSTYFANRGTTWDKTVRQDGYILEIRANYESTADNPFSIIGGNAATVIQNLSELQNYGAQLAFGFGSARVVYRNRFNSSSNSDWVGIIAGSADKLVTSRTIWGQSFNGTANVSGDMSGVGNITSSLSYSLRDSSSNPYLNLKVASQNWFVQSLSDGIYLGSTSTKSLKVDVSGNVTVVGTLGVSGATTLSSTLEVFSASTFHSGFHIGNPNGHETQLYTADNLDGIIIKPIVSGSSDTFQLKRGSNGLVLDFVVHDSSGNSIGGLNMLQLSNASNWHFAYGSLSTKTGATYINGHEVIIQTRYNGNNIQPLVVANDGDVSMTGNVIAAKFIGNLEGNADTATTASKLSTVNKTAWGKTYWTSGGIPTTINGNMSDVGDISFNNNARIHQPDASSSKLYIGNASNNGWVMIANMCSQSGNDKWQILDTGNATFANMLSNGYVTALSDIRKKEVKGSVCLTVDDIANAPSVRFLWKDKRKDGMQVGSIAQYWQKVLPEAVIDDVNGVLSMSYGVIALLASIATARKVQDHERRIAELEKENKVLREQLKDLKTE